MLLGLALTLMAGCGDARLWAPLPILGCIQPVVSTAHLQPLDPITDRRGWMPPLALRPSPMPAALMID